MTKLKKKQARKPEKKVSKTAVVDEARENLAKTFNLGGDEDSDDHRKEYSTYETQKLILLETLDQKNVKDLTNLSDDEIEDIENALMLNLIADNPLIEQVCFDHMHLKRSLTKEPKSLLSHLFDWSTRGFGDSSMFNPIARVLGRKGSS